MEEDVKGVGDYLDILRRRKYWVIIPALLLIAASAAVAYLLPATYKSEGLILIESQEIPDALVRTTVTSYAAQRIEVIKQKIMTTSKVLEIVNKYNLYPELRKNSPPSAIVAVFRENIEVNMVEANVTDPSSGRAKRASIAFTVSFMNKSPSLAQKVANELVTEFLNENVKTRTNRAAETTKFLSEEGDKFQRKVQTLEKQIADFKDEFSDSLPELLEYNLAMVTNLQQEMATNQNQIMVLKDQIMTMSLELSNLQPYLDSKSPVLSANTATTSEQQLQLAKTDYSRLSAKYSANHPDVVQLKRQIANLEAELGVENNELDQLTTDLELAQQQVRDLKQRYAANHPDMKAALAQVATIEDKLKQAKAKNKASADSKPAVNDGQQINPIYLQIKSKIDSSEREIIRLRKRQEEVALKLKDFEARVYQTHQVKRAYDDLTRDHANNVAKYKELRAKQIEAELAQNLESENKGESFTLIEPPQIPNKAEKPNRPKLLAMGVVASVGAGVGLALLIELLFGGVRGYSEIARITGRNPLVVIPIITTEADLSKKRAFKIRMVLLSLILIGVLIYGFHVWVMDLEVLWFKVMRKVSLL